MKEKTQRKDQRTDWYKRQIARLEEKLQGFEQVQEVNQGIVAAMLALAGADCREKAVEVKREALGRMMADCRVRVLPTEDGFQLYLEAAGDTGI